jgi:hypothetical protein
LGRGILKRGKSTFFEPKNSFFGWIILISVSINNKLGLSWFIKAELLITQLKLGVWKL